MREKKYNAIVRYRKNGVWSNDRLDGYTSAQIQEYCEFLESDGARSVRPVDWREVRA